MLLQPGNRGGASAALGGAGSDTVFGARGANTFLSKLTFGAAVCFMVTNFALSYFFSSDSEKSVLDKLPQSSAPAKPAEPDAQGAAPMENAPGTEASKASDEAPTPNEQAAPPAQEQAAPKN